MKVTMDMFNIQDAKTVCEWHYDGQYSIYDYGNWSTALSKGYSITKDQIRRKEYVSFRLEDKLIGFGRLSIVDDYVMLGIGLAPDYCGRGLGLTCGNMLVSEAKARYLSKVVALKVRLFNKRAIECYKKIGFVHERTIQSMDKNKQLVSFAFMVNKSS